MLSKSRQVVFMLALLPTLHHILAEPFLVCLADTVYSFCGLDWIVLQLYTSLTHLMSLRNGGVEGRGQGPRSQA